MGHWHQRVEAKGVMPLPFKSCRGRKGVYVSSIILLVVSIKGI